MTVNRGEAANAELASEHDTNTRQRNRRSIDMRKTHLGGKKTIMVDSFRSAKVFLVFCAYPKIASRCGFRIGL
jgi:hypothetical protein